MHLAYVTWFRVHETVCDEMNDWRLPGEGTSACWEDKRELTGKWRMRLISIYNEATREKVLPSFSTVTKATI